MIETLLRLLDKGWVAADIRRFTPRDVRMILGRKMPDWPSDEEVVRAILSVPTHFADVSITATSVIFGSNATFADGLVYGEAITAGQWLYKDTVDGKYYKASNSTTPSGSGMLVYRVAGLALIGAGTGQRGGIQTGGQVTIGATLTAALEYYLSPNAGNMCPIADVASAKRSIRLGCSDMTTPTLFNIQVIDQGTKP